MAYCSEGTILKRSMEVLHNLFESEGIKPKAKQVVSKAKLAVEAAKPFAASTLASHLAFPLDTLAVVPSSRTNSFHFSLESS